MPGGLALMGAGSKSAPATPYQDEVAVDAPFRYWPMGDAASPLEDVQTGHDMAISGATLDVTGPLATGDVGAVQFDGTNDYGTVSSLDLSDTGALTVEYYLWWDAFAANDDLAIEFTADVGSIAGGFQMNPNSTAMHVVHSAGALNSNMYTRPSAAAWHHYAMVFDVSQAHADEVKLYIDGSLQTPTSHPLTNENAGSAKFANSTLYLMSRAGANLFGAGKMAHLAIYKSVLSSGRIAAHHAAGI